MTYPFKTEPNSIQRKYIEEYSDVPSYALFWEMGCVDSQTEYLSPEGWKNIAQYKGGKVAQWIPRTGMAEFTEPLSYIKSPCDKMVKIYHGYGMDQVLSFEHTVPIMERDDKTITTTTAKELLETCEQIPRGRRLPSVFRMEGQEGISLTDDELRLQIAVMADGSFPKHSPHTLSTGMNLKKIRKVERLTRLLKSTNTEYKLKVRLDGYYIFSFKAPLRLKTYTSLFWKASTHQLKIICDEVMHWDGTFKKSGGSAFFSMKEQDADFIQYAFSSQGSIARKSRAKDGCWCVAVRCEVTNYNISRKHFSIVDSTDGFKYCFEVPSGFLILRRNGCVFPTGNCGKSKAIIDNIGKLWLEKKINGAFIIAPSGVDANWELDEIPAHMPDSIRAESRVFRYRTNRSSTKSQKTEAKWHREFTGLAVLIMSYDAIMTLEGQKTAMQFLEKRRVFYTLDESVAIKTPGAKRTMRIVRTAHRAEYKRILDGYPTPKGAFDLYAPFRFLDENFWKKNQLADYGMFKHYFGVFENTKTDPITGKVTKLHNHNTGHDYEVLVGYQHLEELNKIITPISSRVLKSEVLDLPEKIYQPRYFELSPEQRKLYDELVNEYRVWLDSGDLVTANLAIVRELRLQQISCGYIPTENDEEPIHRIPGKNTRLELFESLIDDNDKKKIVWATYRLDVEAIRDVLATKKNRKVVLYTGATSDEDRIKAKKEFQEGDAEIFLATQAAAHRGHTLHAAEFMYYYSNNMNLVHRKQSEDRAHRMGLKHVLSIVDLLGVNTRDKKIMLNLCGKMNTGDVILGDAPGVDIRTALKEWLQE